MDPAQRGNGTGLPQPARSRLRRRGQLAHALERTIIDVLPPTDELVNRAYISEFPHVPANEPHTFRGVANDVGNVPQPSRPGRAGGHPGQHQRRHHLAGAVQYRRKQQRHPRRLAGRLRQRPARRFAGGSACGPKGVPGK